jgi:hypothetical protein
MLGLGFVSYTTLRLNNFLGRRLLYLIGKTRVASLLSRNHFFTTIFDSLPCMWGEGNCKFVTKCHTCEIKCHVCNVKFIERFQIRFTYWFFISYYNLCPWNFKIVQESIEFKVSYVYQTNSFVTYYSSKIIIIICPSNS